MFFDVHIQKKYVLFLCTYFANVTLVYCIADI